MFRSLELICCATLALLAHLRRMVSRRDEPLHHLLLKQASRPRACSRGCVSCLALTTVSSGIRHFDASCVAAATAIYLNRPSTVSPTELQMAAMLESSLWVGDRKMFERCVQFMEGSPLRYRQRAMTTAMEVRSAFDGNISVDEEMAKATVFPHVFLVEMGKAEARTGDSQGAARLLLESMRTISLHDPFRKTTSDMHSLYSQASTG